jgi:hypothetical protein
VGASLLAIVTGRGGDSSRKRCGAAPLDGASEGLDKKSRKQPHAQ